MNKQSGFTLLEIMLALFILVGAISVFSDLHFRSLMRLWKGREDIDRVFLIRKHFYDLCLRVPQSEKLMHKLKDKPLIEEVEKPDLKLSSQLLEINKKSDLKDFIEVIDILRTEGEWKSGPKIRKLGMIGFVLKPEGKK